MLESDYALCIAKSGSEALEVVVSSNPPDLILIDTMMPEMDGIDILDYLLCDKRMLGIPVIILADMDQPLNEEFVLRRGTVDYITKRANPGILRARIRNQIELKRARDALSSHNQQLQFEVARSREEVRLIQSMSVDALTELAKIRDNETGNHIQRTQEYVRVLATRLLKHPRHENDLDMQMVDMIAKSAPLHDIGKVGIPDHILLKPGRFTPEEFEIMKTHTTLGRDAILAAERHLGMEVGFLSLAKEIAYYHQEKWDGSGYPTGARGEQIPISARLMAVADVYDALISQRPYKDGLPHDRAVEIMREGRGTHFDPDVLDAFLALQDEFRSVALIYAG